MDKGMREYVFSTASGVVAGLVAGTLGGVVGGATLGLVLMVVTDEGLAAYFPLFVALIAGAIGVPIGVIAGMLKPVICQRSATRVAWIVVSGLGAGLGARLFYGYETALLVVFTALGAIIAAVPGQYLTLRFGSENGEEATPKKMIYYTALLLAGFLLVAPAVYAGLELLDRLLFSVID